MENLSHLIVGPLIWLFGYIFKTHPPKKINPIYGYRTPMSMKNEHTWKVANEYSADLMMKVGIATTLFQVVVHLIWGLEAALMAGSVFLVAGLL